SETGGFCFKPSCLRTSFVLHFLTEALNRLLAALVLREEVFLFRNRDFVSELRQIFLCVVLLLQRVLNCFLKMRHIISPVIRFGHGLSPPFPSAVLVCVTWELLHTSTP